MKSTLAHILILAGLVLASFWALTAVGQEHTPNIISPPMACVRVFVMDKDGTPSIGSGTYIRYHDQAPCVVTAAHVVKNRKSSSVQVLFPNWEVVIGRIVKVSSHPDLCKIMLDHAPVSSPIGFTKEETDSYTVFGYGGGIPKKARGKLGSTHYEDGYREILGVASRNGDSGGSILDSHGLYAGTLWGSDDKSTMFSPAAIVGPFINERTK